jgi:RNA polymerase sigma-70 factor (ECF subfamily)
MPESDAAIVARTIETDRNAYGELVRRYQPMVWAQSLSITGRREEAENLTQEAFLKAYRALPGLREREAFAGWLLGIARNLGLDWLRRRQREEASAPTESAADLGGLDAPDPAGVTPAEEVERREMHRRALAAVAALPPEYAVAVTLKHQAGLSCREMAEVLGVPTGTVTSRLSRAHQMLRERLATQGQGD